MSHPYRIQPPKPIDIKGSTMLIALDCLIGSLRVSGNGLWKYTSEQREMAANELLKIFNETQFTVVHSDGATEPTEETG